MVGQHFGWDEPSYIEEQEQRRPPFWVCLCGHPDLPGRCPGWVNCPMCEIEEDDEEEETSSP